MTDTAAALNDPAQPADPAAKPADTPPANAPEGGELAGDHVDKPTDAAKGAESGDASTDEGDITLDVYAGLEAPDGLPDDAVQTVKDTAAQFDMSLEQAQKLAEATAKQSNELAQQQQQWDADWKKHPKFGGSDENLVTSKALIDQAVRRFDPNGELTALLESTGHHNHPAVRSYLASIGQAMRTGPGVPASGTPAAKPVSEEQQKYPDMYNADGTPK